VRVLSIIHYPVFGGPHNRNLHLVPMFAAAGVETIIALPDEPGNAADRLAAAGIEVIKLPLQRVRNLSQVQPNIRFITRFHRGLEALRKLIRERAIDLVQINGLVNPHGAIAARFENAAVVWQLLDSRAPMIARRALMPLVTRLADVVMSTGKAVALSHPGAAGLEGRLVFFFPPVDTERFKPDPAHRAGARAELGLADSDLVVGNVGNINPLKGHLTFVRAAAQLHRAHPEVRFVILGATYDHYAAYAESVVREAQSLGLRLDRDLIIHQPGSRVAFLEQAFDIFWLTSEPRSEGIPTVVEEAMALALPVVAVDVASVGEAVIHSRTGLLVPPLAPRALADATIGMIEAHEMRRRMGAEGRRRALECFNVKACFDTHAHAYQVALEQHRR
jgi:glycosyltransferase involved in cell wall biosynthesis